MLLQKTLSKLKKGQSHVLISADCTGFQMTTSFKGLLLLQLLLLHSFPVQTTHHEGQTPAPDT